MDGLLISSTFEGNGQDGGIEVITVGCVGTGTFVRCRKKVEKES